MKNPNYKKLSKFLNDEVIDLKIKLEKQEIINKTQAEQLILYGTSKSLNEFMPLRLKRNQKVVVTKNKTAHCYKVGDVLRIIKPHYRNKAAWYCRKGWFGTRQVLTDQEFYVC
jgi:hypothetical protein